MPRPRMRLMDRTELVPGNTARKGSRGTLHVVIKEENSMNIARKRERERERQR